MNSLYYPDDDEDSSCLIKDDPQDDFSLGTAQPDVLPIRTEKTPIQKQSFKRPRNPAPRSRACPDYKVHPGKWTYYNLEDVSPDSMSEKSNTDAAQRFLKSINLERANKKQKMEPEDTETTSDCDKSPPSPPSPPKVIFRKPQKKDVVNDTTSPESDRDGGGVTVMPEYVIGQKTVRKPRPTKGASTSQSNATVTISHVMEEDFDEEEGSSDEDSLLAAKPTRTVFSGCERESIIDSKPMEVEQSFFGFLGKKSMKNVRNKVLRCTRDSDSDDENSKESTDNQELDGVD